MSESMNPFFFQFFSSFWWILSLAFKCFCESCRQHFLVSVNPEFWKQKIRCPTFVERMSPWIFVRYSLIMQYFESEKLGIQKSLNEWIHESSIRWMCNVLKAKISASNVRWIHESLKFGRVLDAYFFNLEQNVAKSVLDVQFFQLENEEVLVTIHMLHNYVASEEANFPFFSAT